MSRWTLPYDWNYDAMDREEYIRDKEIIESGEKGDIEAVETELYSLDLPEEIMRKVQPAKLRVANLYLTGSYTNKQIAAIVGIASTTVSKWLHSPELTKVMEKLQERELKLSQTHLSSLREKAINTMADLLDSNMDNVRFQAARDILDRSGMKAVSVSKIDKTVTTLDQQIADLADFTIDDGDVIDIDLEDMMNG